VKTAGDIRSDRIFANAHSDGRGRLCATRAQQNPRVKAWSSRWPDRGGAIIKPGAGGNEVAIISAMLP